jgi:hypothetical protein
MEELLYTDFEAAEKSLQKQSAKKGFVVNKLRSKKSKKGEIRKVWYACVHSRTYVQNEYINTEKKKRKTTTRRLDCPWRATIKRMDSMWKISLNVVAHNHDMAEKLGAYHEMRTLHDDERKLV